MSLVQNGSFKTDGTDEKTHTILNSVNVGQIQVFQLKHFQKGKTHTTLFWQHRKACHSSQHTKYIAQN